MNTSARTGRKWNERPIQEVVVRVLVIVKMLGTELIRDRDPDTLGPSKTGSRACDYGWDFRPIYVGRATP
jgi:hypothetical protein